MERVSQGERRDMFLRLMKHYGNSNILMNKNIARILQRGLFGKAYMSRIAAGKQKIPDKTYSALLVLAVEAGLQASGLIEIKTAPGRYVHKGAICFVGSVKCANPECGVQMIPRHNKYCSPACRRAARQEKRREAA